MWSLVGVSSSPANWSVDPHNPAVSTRQLLTGTDAGDSFALLRLAAGASTEIRGSAQDRLLVLSGRLGAAGADHHRGDYVALPGEQPVTITGDDVSMVVRITGEGLGAPARDVFGPAGWIETSPGQWARLLTELPGEAPTVERIVGVAYMEPGSASPRHHHHNPHRFLYLDGEVDDEIVFPDGRRQAARRRAGEFVDYPVGIDHQSFSRDAATILFVHEPLLR